MKQKNESKIKIKPRFTTLSGVPNVRTQVDFQGNEISKERKLTNDINRTDLVKKKHEAKYRSKKEKETANKDTKNKKKN